MRFGLASLLLFAIASSTSAQVSGVVRDAEGKPIAGAQVMLYARKSNWGLDNEVIERVQSAADGAYHFTKKLAFEVPTGTTYNDYYIVTAAHPDFAFGWANIIASEQRSTYDIVLTKPMKQTFIVKDAEGNPISGATIWIQGAGNADDPQASLRDDVNIPTDIGLVTATTDDQGRATMEHLPRTQLSVIASHKGFADEWKSFGHPAAKEIALKMTSAGVVRGTVRSEDGQAVGGAIVWFEATWMHDKNFARTNSDGQYECDTLVAKGGSWAEHGGNGTYNVYIQHPDFCSPIAQITVDPEQTIDNFDISAEKGSLLRVKVTDPETHDPVGGVRVQAQVNDRWLEGFTNPKGQIEWRTLPGQATVLMVGPPGGTYLIGDLPSEIISVTGEETEATLQPPTPFKPTVAVSGYVVDAVGKPAKGAIVCVSCAERHILTVGQFGFSATAVTNEDGAYTVHGFPSSTRMYVYVETRDRKLAGIGEFDVPNIGGDLKDPLRLTSTQSADVDLHKLAGKDLSNRKMLIAPMVKAQRMPRISRSVTADKQSHLQLDGILPGVTYRIDDARAQESAARRLAGDLFSQDVVIIPAP
jgi:hypothetical protein